MSELDLKCLQRRWVHSFEEDNAQETVYRPETFDLPKARGRVSLDLKENGEVADAQLGRNDVPDTLTGSWRLEGNDIIVEYPGGQADQIYSVKEVTNEKLVLKKRE